ERAHLLYRGKDDLRANRAVETDHISGVLAEPLIQLGRENLGCRSISCFALIGDSHLCKDDEIAKLTHGADCLVKLCKVVERLEHEAIHTAFEERLCLPLKVFLRFL